MAEFQRIYIRVIGLFETSGVLTPKKIEVPGEGVFKIEQVLGMRTLKSTKTGGVGFRYTIVINGRWSYLYFEPADELTGNHLGSWFISKQVA